MQKMQKMAEKLKEKIKKIFKKVQKNAKYCKRKQTKCKKNA